MRESSASELPPPPGNRTLVLAWIVEGLAVATGLSLAVYAGLESGSLGHGTAMAVLPFLALAAVELAKIPLIGLAFRTQTWGWKVIATLALTIVTLATCANFVFGFERGFNERLRAVEAAEQKVVQLQAAQDQQQVRLGARQSDLQQQHAQIAALRQQRAELHSQRDKDSEAVFRFDGRAPLQSDLRKQQEAIAALGATQDRQLAAEYRRCRQAPETPCRSAALQRLFATQNEARQRAAELIERRIREEGAKLRSDWDSVRTKRDADLAALDQKLAEAQDKPAVLVREVDQARQAALQAGAMLAGAQQELAAMQDASQLHRLALVLFGSAEHEPVERTKQIFVVTLAGIVAVMGSLLAVLHYAAQPRVAPQHTETPVAEPAKRQRRRPSAWEAMLRARRGYLARRRGELPVTRTVEVVREMPIDRLKVVYLPLDASEEQIAHSRRMARQSIA